MLITKYALKKPVTVTIFFLCVVLMSFFALKNLPLSLMPNLDYPRLTIKTSWSGASPQEVESKVTSQIEAIGSTVKGIQNVNSTSYSAYSVVNLEFTREIDMNFARFELNEKLQLLKDKLPEDVTPTIGAYIPRNMDGGNFLEFGISGPYQTEELKKLTEKFLKYKITSTEGVSACDIRGYQDKLIKIKIHNSDITNVNSRKIQNALRNVGQINSISKFKQQGLSYNIAVDDSIEKLREIKNLWIKKNDGTEIRLREISTIETSYEDARVFYRYNGKPQVRLIIAKENTANAIRLAKEVKKIVNEVKLPQNIVINKIADESEKIQKDLNILYKRGFISIAIIFLVLILFLRHLTSTFLVLSTIILSSSLTFILMYFMGIGLNMLSLAGLALGFGMMVDNSIVVYENIFRNQFRGLSKFNAAMIGVKEISLAIIASTITTIIVFGPFLYVSGDMKLLFMPFIYAMSLALLSSLFVSFTYIPFASLNFLSFKVKNAVPEDEFHFDPELNRFQKIMKFVLRFRWIWLILVLGMLAGSVYIFVEEVDKGYTWNFPRDDYLRIYISLPVGSNIDQTNYIAKNFEEKILGANGVTEIKTRVSGRSSSIDVEFDEVTKETADPLILREKLKAYAVNFGNSSIYIRGFGPSFGGGGSSYANFSLTLKGYNFDKLKDITEELAVFMEGSTRRVRSIKTNALSRWETNELFEYEVVFDRNKLADYQINIYEIIGQVYSKLSSRMYKVDKNISNQEFSFSVIDEKLDDFEITDLKNLNVANYNNSLVKLSEIAEIKKIVVLPRIERKNELYTRKINFDYRGSHRKGRDFIEGLKENYKLPFGYTFEKDENYGRFDEKEDRFKMVWILVFAIILVYMTLAALFESFKYPFIILLTLPLAFIGVVLIFYFTEETFTTYAQIGLILLTGIVVNNSIIMVFRINQLRGHGINRDHSILQAVRDRCRPILMTSLTTVMGLLPMLWKTTEGQNDFWRLLSLSTIGGLVTSTFFVLTFIPILYRIFSRENKYERINENT